MLMETMSMRESIEDSQDLGEVKDIQQTLQDRQYKAIQVRSHFHG